MVERGKGTLVSIWKVTRVVARVVDQFWYVQRSHLAKQSNKPKLQSRIPSAPIGRLLAFLLPAATIGPVACNTQAMTTLDVQLMCSCSSRNTHLRLATDRFLDICHGREEHGFVVGIQWFLRTLRPFMQSRDFAHAQDRRPGHVRSHTITTPG